jgi:methyltransferase (TIGR00027 family)
MRLWVAFRLENFLFLLTARYLSFILSLLTIWSVRIDQLNATIDSAFAISPAELSDIARTSLLTLYARALESQSATPILIDAKAIEITRRLNPRLASSPVRLLRSLASGRISQQLCVHLALRAGQYDAYARQFLARFPEGSIVNLGCGLDTRNYRVDNGHANFFDLDLPEVIRFKRDYVDENPRYRMIAASIFDYTWMDLVEQMGSRPALFLAEGVFMYLDPDKVRALFVDLRRRFPGSELVCEVVNSRWLSKTLQPIIRTKMQRQLGLGADATFKFGIKDGREPETWGQGIQLLDEWSYFDTKHPKLGWTGWMGRVELFRKTQWTVHYRLGSA